MWISIDGIEGSGKTTFLKAIEAEIKRRSPNAEIVHTRAIGTGEYGEFLREQYLTEKIKGPTLALAKLSLHANVNQIGSWNRVRGKTVLQDRSLATYWAIDLGDSDHSNQWTRNAFYDLHEQIALPDVSIILKVDPQLARARLNARSLQLGPSDARSFDHFNFMDSRDVHVLQVEQDRYSTYRDAIECRGGDKHGRIPMFVFLDGNLPVEENIERFFNILTNTDRFVG